MNSGHFLIRKINNFSLIIHNHIIQQVVKVKIVVFLYHIFSTDYTKYSFGNNLIS